MRHLASLQGFGDRNQAVTVAAVTAARILTGLFWRVPRPTAKQLEPLGEPFRPCRSVAAWYCWRAAELYAGAAESTLTR
jgi:3-methyladenine DNA glycosylase/8-oxoguanine DNA glycosylase